MHYNEGVPYPEEAPMPLYEVTVERTEQATLWIEAESRVVAR